MTRPKDWTPGMIAVALCAALVASGAMWALLALSPPLAALVATWAATVGSCVYVTTRTLRAKLAAAEEREDAWNLAAKRTDLDVIGGPVSPAGGTRRVELYDQDAPAYSAAGTVDVGHLTVAGDASGWLGPEQIQFRTPVLSEWQAEQMEPMTVAETDRLIANLEALPGKDSPDAAALEYIRNRYSVPAYVCGHVTVDGRQGVITGGRDGYLLVVFAGADEHPMPCHPTWRVVYNPSDWHLGQPCATCGAPSTSWVSERPDPEISDVTFLCDGCYAAAMADAPGGPDA